MHAVRNIRLCTKDCMCLYVCPTGATDTEDGQIDAKKCLDGCRACVDACPSHAISLVPDKYPAQQEKTDTTVDTLIKLLKSKLRQEALAASVAENTDDPVKKQLAAALMKSNRLLAEDLIREAGFMLPQSENTKKLLYAVLDGDVSDDFPVDAVRKLLEIL